MSHAIRLLLAVFLLISVTEKAASCSCSENIKDIKSEVRRHSLVFSGTVVSTKIIKEKTETGYRTKHTTYKLVPDKFWRGMKVDTIYIEQEFSLCDQVLHDGKAYVIYAFENHGSLSTCSRFTEFGIEHESQILDKLFTRKRFKQLQAAG